MTNVCVYSAHEGSSSWQALLKIIHESDHDVSISNTFLVADSEYRSVAGGVISRFFVRLKIYILYPAMIFFHILFLSQKYDIIVAITSPFFLPYLCAFFLNKTPFIILHNDCFPEALVQARLIPADSIFDKFLLFLRQFATRRALCNIFISENHRRIIESKVKSPIKSSVIPVGAIGSIFSGHQIDQTNNPILIIYCGTLGLMHEYSTVVDCLSKYGLPSSIFLEFKISGAGRIPFQREVIGGLRDLVTARQLVISDPIPDGLWVEKMKSSSIGLILQSKGGEDVIFPSKFFSILVSGQAVLAISSLESELAKIVLDNNCGWIIEPGDLVGLHRVFQEIQIPEVLATKRRNAYNLGHSQYSIESLSIQWIEQLNSASFSNPDV